MIFAGNDSALWLIRNDADKKIYSVAMRKTGGKWKWVDHNRTGKAVVAAAVGEKLLVLFDSGNCRIFREGASLVGDKLGVTPLAACPAENLDGSDGVLVVVESNVTAASKGSKPTTAPAKATQKKPISKKGGCTRLVRLSVRKNTDPTWPELTYLCNVPLTSDGRVYVAATGRTLFLLTTACEGGRENCLFARTSGRWRRIALTQRFKDDYPLAMQSFGGQLVIVLAGAEKNNGKYVLHLAGTDSEAKKFTYQPVKTPTSPPPTWEADNLPSVARMADQLALLWTDDDSTVLASCKLDGDFTPPSGISLFDRPPSEGAGMELYSKFLIGLMVTIFILMFIVRPRVAPGPFVLPPEVKPAKLHKRALAAIIDMFPFSFLGMAIFFPDLVFSANPPQNMDEAREIFANRPDAMFYFYLTFLCLYTAYSIIMEWRFGATLGKMALKIRIVANGADKADFRAVLMRNLARIIPLSSFHLVFLLILFPLINSNRQRLGDMLARTTVITTEGEETTKGVGRREKSEENDEQQTTTNDNDKC